MTVMSYLTLETTRRGYSHFDKVYGDISPFEKPEPLWKGSLALCWESRSQATANHTLPFADSGISYGNV